MVIDVLLGQKECPVPALKRKKPDGESIRRQVLVLVSFIAHAWLLLFEILSTWAPPPQLILTSSFATTVPGRTCLKKATRSERANDLPRYDFIYLQ